MRTMVLAAAVALVLSACGGSDSPTARMPDLELAALGGGTDLDIARLRGPAVVNLWATWCQPCREEMPAFQQVAAARADVRFIGVNSAETGEAQAFLDELGITYEQYIDERGELAEALGAAGLPVTVVVDAAGLITTEHLGPMTADDLEDALRDVTG